MQAVQVPDAGAPFEVTDLPKPSPGPNEVRVRVEACGICHSDAFVKEGTFPGLEYPRVPGHEVTGVVDAVGEAVDGWTDGDRVGVGWHGGHCFTCAPCRAGDFVNCENQHVTGISFDGGYAEFMCAPQEAVAALPSELDFTDAAPLLCAGITTYNALRNADASPGSCVAVQGIGGLGHLAVQYARTFGHEVVALSRSSEKESLAKELGAHHFIDTTAQDPAEALQEIGGASVILATAPNAEAISRLTGGLGRDGTLMIVAATGEPVEVAPLDLIMGRCKVQGWPSGTADDSEDTLDFSALTDVRPRTETYPLSEAAGAYERMIKNDARFRVVLVPDRWYEG